MSGYPPEQQRAYAKAHYEANKEAYKARAAAWKVANRAAKLESQRGTNLRLKYGIEPTDFEQMFLEQEGRCPLCFVEMVTGDTRQYSGNGARRACVDHDHETGKIRGILCNRCNRSIGLLRDDPAILRRAADYLEKN